MTRALKRANSLQQTVVAFALAAATAAAIAAEPLSYEQAWARMRDSSDKLAAARAAAESKAERTAGLKNLGGPSVSVSGAAFRYSASLDVSLDPLNQKLAQINGQLPVPLDQLPIPITLPSFPAKYTYRRSDSATTGSVSAVAPLYLGGATDAVRGLATAQQQEAEADALQAEDELSTLLAQRYFGAQLARRAATLRSDAARGIAQHDAAVERMQAAGVVSRVERLQARAALEDARQQASKAESDAELAALALARTVKLDSMVQPSTPLAVSTQSLPPLQQFIDAALVHHPGLAKVTAKKAQAEQLHEGSSALRRPQVFAFGQRELTTGRADWVAGIGVRWTLFDSLDRAAMDRASMQQVRQAELTDAQARSDIALLVEKQWRAAEQARLQYLSMQAQVELADELVKLRTSGLREGTSTGLDLIDAELNRAKVQTQRAQAAYEHLMALAALLEASGQSQRLPEFLARADLKVE